MKKKKYHLGRRDILGAAETGSGKTLAFGLPILSGILKLKEKAAQKFSSDNKEELEGNDDGNINSGWSFFRLLAIKIYIDMYLLIDEDINNNSDDTNSENEELEESAESNNEEEDVAENANSGNAFLI